MEEKRQVASQCEASLGYDISTLVDEMNDEVMNAYTGVPDRLYLVDANGRVAYAGFRGPWGSASASGSAAIEIWIAGAIRGESAHRRSLPSRSGGLVTRSAGAKRGRRAAP